MKKKLLIIHAVVILILGSNISASAQKFITGEQSTIKPSQVIIDNYTAINLSKEIIEDPQANRFDIKNPYTYLQIVNDEKLNSYHILFQTSFEGKILFLSYSNNLSALFNRKDKPANLFMHCLKEINNHLSSIENTRAAIKCIVERLNYCADD